MSRAANAGAAGSRGAGRMRTCLRARHAFAARFAAFFAARDIRLDGVPQPPPTSEVDLAAFAEKCALRVHPDRRKGLGDRAVPGRG